MAETLAQEEALKKLREELRHIASDLERLENETRAALEEKKAKELSQKLDAL